MLWNEERDILFPRKMSATSTFNTKSGSRDRGNILGNVATGLNAYNDLTFILGGARDRFTDIM